MQMQQQGTAQRTILLVEDDDDARSIYSTMLSHAGFRVIEAIDGDEAVESALGDPPDLILLDMNLPTVDGWEAARRIRIEAEGCAVPMIAFSALIDSTGDLRRDAALFDGFITKPVRPGDLVKRVAAYVDLLAPAARKSCAPARSPRARSEPSRPEAQAGKALQ
jgi:DNA-binding response OmpR family regulator